MTFGHAVFYFNPREKDEKTNPYAISYAVWFNSL